MTLERTILLFAWVIGLATIAFFVTRPKPHRFILAYMMCGSLVWIKVAHHVYFNMVIFPVREFPNATNFGFTPQYMLYPLICSLYIISEPQGSWLRRVLHLLLFTVPLTFLHTALAFFTDLMEFVRYNALTAWLYFITVFVTTNGLVRWFFREPVLFLKRRGDD
ncbi:CBO0543 family protein [Paenibacillus turpanensis]|uniref:CBO0543 family protein n=1 Tax=Paenibacillus turpanensis TaxID=2689078 RepID=UPI00140BC612|nr:CBO0543 family protein [Paenibacillus turpanensis]